jgi:hypothetical protein
MFSLCSIESVAASTGRSVTCLFLEPPITRRENLALCVGQTEPAFLSFGKPIHLMLQARNFCLEPASFRACQVEIDLILRGHARGASLVQSPVNLTLSTTDDPKPR